MEDTTTTGKSLAAFPLLAVVLGNEVDAQAEFGPLTDTIEAHLQTTTDAAAEAQAAEEAAALAAAEATKGKKPKA
jgi:hypothetical protein